MGLLPTLCQLVLLACLLHSAVGQNDGTCPEGFSGNKCSICQTDAACVESTGHAEATCSNNVTYAPNSQLKSYSCDLGGGLGALFKPGSLLVQCHTGLAINETLAANDTLSAGNGTTKGSGRRLLQDSGSSSNSSGEPFCTIDMVVKSPEVPVACKASGCSIGANASKAECFQASCECVGGCNDGLIQSVINSVKAPVSIACEPDGSCSLALGGVGVESIPATCKVGECLVPTNETRNATDAGPAVSNLNTNPIIAAIPLMVLTVIVLFLGTYTLANRHLWKYNISESDAVEIERLAKEASTHEARLGSLEFKNLTVLVHMASQRQMEEKKAALKANLKGGASGGGSSDAGQKHRQSGNSKQMMSRVLHSFKLFGGDVEAGQPQKLSGKDSTGADAAAEYICGLHTGSTANQWFILRDVTFTARAGEVVGVLGPSGCGKTTLLGSIAGSASDLGGGAVKSGLVLVDGKKRRKHDVAYVPQSDVLIPSLTVQECLRYSALLRLPVDTKPLDLQVRIEQVIEELGLQHVAESQVGGGGRIRGVSGGERRRVTIGMELVTDPAILVLDEPTSGLDSFTAINLMRSLRMVAARGRVVVASLHQPSRDMFLSLDQVLLMAQGQLLYGGRPGDAEAWLARRGLTCPDDMPVAEYMLQIANSASDIQRVLQAQKEAQAAAALQQQQLGLPLDASSPKRGLSADSAIDAGEEFSFSTTPRREAAAKVAAALAVGGAQQAQQAAAPEEQTQGGHSRSTSLTASELDVVVSEKGKLVHKSRKPGIARQLAVLFWRAWVDMFRSPTLFRLHVIIGVATGLLTGVVFWNLELNNVGVQNRMGGTFFALAFFAFAALTTVDLLMNERAVVTREVRGGYYNPILYLLSKLTLDGMLLRAIPAVLYWAPFYYMAGFRTGAAYAATYVFCLISFSGAVGALSMAVTVATDTPGQASFTMNVILLFSLIFTGFLVNVESMPDAISWIHYLSVFYYAFEAMVTNEINGLIFTFQAAGFGEVDNVTGETFLTTLGFNVKSTTNNIIALISMYGGFALLAMALFVLRLPRTSKGRRRRWWAAGKRRLGLQR